MRKEDQTALRWAIKCNDEYACGYLGPTVMRRGPLLEMEVAVRLGWLRCEEDCRAEGRRSVEKCGYWITTAGRAALQPTPPGDEK